MENMRISAQEQRNQRIEAERKAYAERVDAAIAKACGDSVKVDTPITGGNWRWLTSRADPTMRWSVEWRHRVPSYFRGREDGVPTEITIAGPRIPRSRGRWGAAKMVARTPERLMERAAEFIHGRSVDERIDESTVEAIRRWNAGIDAYVSDAAKHPVMGWMREHVGPQGTGDERIDALRAEHEEWREATIARQLGEFLLREAGEAEKRLARTAATGSAT